MVLTISRPIPATVASGLYGEESKKKSGEKQGNKRNSQGSDGSSASVKNVQKKENENKKKGSGKSDTNGGDPCAKGTAARKGGKADEISDANSAPADPAGGGQKEKAGSLLKNVNEKLSSAPAGKGTGRARKGGQSKTESGDAADQGYLRTNDAMTKIRYGVCAKLQNPACGSGCIQKVRSIQIF